MKAVKIILITILSTAIMFGIFKNLLSQGSSENIATLINDGAFLVDVRTPTEFLGGSAKGAVNIPLNEVPNQLAKFKDKKHIIVFCRSGNRSSQAKSILEKNDFTNVTDGRTWQNVNSQINQK